MARWEPGARGRLTQAALDLYAERGFEQTTALEVAERAGVTERTYFRYFVDKREVLFDGSAELEGVVVAAMESAPSSLLPFDLVTVALEGTAPLLEGRREFATKRAAVIAANPALQERELLKLAALTEVVAQALRKRGVADLAATLVAEAGVMLFRTAFDTWIRKGPSVGFAETLRQTTSQFRGLTIRS